MTARLREPAFVLGIVLLVGAVAALPVLHEPYFYYRDDNVVYFMPMLQEIASLLKQGLAPFITDRIWYGGAILAEYQYGVLNPLNLLAYLAMSGFTNVGLAAAFFAVLHYGWYAAGIVTLCRTLGLNRTAAAAAATTACSSAWLLYWAAPSWISGLSSIAWMPWGAVALVQAYRKSSWLLPAGLLVATPALCGYPFTTFAWTLVLAVMTAVILRYGEDRPGAVRVVAAIAGGGLIALPALLPLAFYMQDTARSPDPATVTQWRASLDGLIAVGLPTFASGWPTRSGIAFVPAPFYYACWFGPLAVVTFDWRQPWDWRLRAFVAMTACFAALAILPGIGWLRWPMRYIAFFHLGFALCIGWVMTFDTRTWRDGRPLAPVRICLCIGVPIIAAIMNAPSMTTLHLVFGAAIASLALLLSVAGNLAYLRNAILFGGQIALLGGMIAIFPRNVATPDLRPELLRPALETPSDTGNLLSLRETNTAERPDPGFWQETAYGNRGIFLGRRTINGYTPALLKDLSRTLCFDYVSAACPTISDKLFERDSFTGLTLIDLLRVDRITADSGHRRLFAERAGDAWQELAVQGTQAIFARSQALATRPGSVTWTEGDITLKLIRRQPSEELYEVAVGSGSGRVMFARAWYQGFTATLDGRPVTLVAHRGIFPLLTLPAGSSGVLALRYRPPGLDLGLLAAGAAAVLLVLLSFVPALRSNRRNDDSRRTSARSTTA